MWDSNQMKNLSSDFAYRIQKDILEQIMHIPSSFIRNIWIEKKSQQIVT